MIQGGMEGMAVVGVVVGMVEGHALGVAVVGMLVGCPEGQDEGALDGLPEGCPVVGLVDGGVVEGNPVGGVIVGSRVVRTAERPPCVKTMLRDIATTTISTMATMPRMNCLVHRLSGSTTSPSGMSGSSTTVAEINFSGSGASNAAGSS
mmetsp:Transcript_5964/g.13252  ORF Transcript_5964/g.13252 Transcript_5964/m.13252 type:complete len:149 (-) Transcript_5964:141-587(-)